MKSTDYHALLFRIVSHLSVQICMFKSESPLESAVNFPPRYTRGQSGKDGLGNALVYNQGDPSSIPRTKVNMPSLMT